MQVLKRWRKIEDILQKEGIQVLGWSSDGDPRMLRAMRISAELPTNSLPSPEMPTDWISWFNAKYCPSFCCMQDNTHICAKLKNRMYNNTILLVIGNHIVSRNHLQILLDTVSKDKHLLVDGDIIGTDKMAFKPVLKISSASVRDALKTHVPGSDGTIFYLQIIHNVYKSMSMPDVTPLDRISLIWHSIQQ